MLVEGSHGHSGGSGLDVPRQKMVTFQSWSVKAVTGSFPNTSLLHLFAGKTKEHQKSTEL